MSMHLRIGAPPPAPRQPRHYRDQLSLPLLLAWLLVLLLPTAAGIVAVATALATVGLHAWAGRMLIELRRGC